MVGLLQEAERLSTPTQKQKKRSGHETKTKLLVIHSVTLMFGLPEKSAACQAFLLCAGDTRLHQL